MARNQRVVPAHRHRKVSHTKENESVYIPPRNNGRDMFMLILILFIAAASGGAMYVVSQDQVPRQQQNTAGPDAITDTLPPVDTPKVEEGGGQKRRSGQAHRILDRDHVFGSSHCWCMFGSFLMV